MTSRAFNHVRLLAAAIAAVLLMGACGGDAVGTADAPRTVEIEALDALRFEPAEVVVQAGETIRFVVTNTGETVHEFVVGPEHVQMAHEEASDMGEMHGDMDPEGQLVALELQPGATEEATVTFDTAGDLLIGCHEPGHYDGGMAGKVTIEA